MEDPKVKFLTGLAVRFSLKRHFRRLSEPMKLKTLLVHAVALVILSACGREQAPLPPAVLYPMRSDPSSVGFINDEGKFVLPPVYESAEDFYEGLAAMEGEGWSGYLDPEGKVVIRFDEVMWRMGSFHNGLAYLATTKAEGYINRQGQKVYWRRKLGT